MEAVGGTQTTSLAQSRAGKDNEASSMGSSGGIHEGRSPRDAQVPRCSQRGLTLWGGEDDGHSYLGGSSYLKKHQESSTCPVLGVHARYHAEGRFSPVSGWDLYSWANTPPEVSQGSWKVPGVSPETG